MRRAGALLALLLALGAPSLARADGDPASDVLLAQDVFHPYRPNDTSPPVRQALDGMVARAKASGFRVKVALIAAKADLGAYPYLFGQPARYAELLAKELTLTEPARVLVVLPQGIGTRNLGPLASALDGLRPGVERDGDGLARVAMLALGRLTRATGHPVAVPAVARAAPDDGGGGGGRGPLVALPVGGVTLVILAGAVLAVRRGSRGDPA